MIKIITFYHPTAVIIISSFFARHTLIIILHYILSCIQNTTMLPQDVDPCLVNIILSNSVTTFNRLIFCELSMLLLLLLLLYTMYSNNYRDLLMHWNILKYIRTCAFKKVEYAKNHIHNIITYIIYLYADPPVYEHK